MELGQNIARLRKERNLTQEQLGQALGISGQAVSKWEKGGMPDTEMLPHIADYLGVSIDVLYGRPGEPLDNMATILARWLRTLPGEQRMMELFRLLCKVTQGPYNIDDNEMVDNFISQILDLPAQSCYSSDFVTHTENQIWMHSILYLTQGLQLAVAAEDCPFYLLMPEPPQGYEKNLTGNERYRSLFSTLGMPGALEILRYLYHREDQFYFPAVLSKRTGISMEETNAALSAMAQCNLIRKNRLETENGSEDVYRVHNNGAIVPFLLLGKWLTEKEDIWMGAWYDRERPILKKAEEGEAHE